MLVKLSAPGLRAISDTSATSFIGRICEQADSSELERSKEIFLAKDQTDLPVGFRGYLLKQEVSHARLRDVYVIPPEQQYLSGGDIVRIDPVRHRVTALYRRASPSNSFLVTERCDNYCVMCSQPPKEQDDSWLVDELREVVPLIAPETRELGITGGEPGLLGERLIELIALMKQHLPQTAVHILSNGRSFAKPDFARALGQVNHPDLMIGIPLYSDLPEEHDYVVQAKGAFNDTILGILNLKRARVRVEVRFVIHAETYARMPDFARFVTRNLLFVDHVALMGLELMGFAKTNLPSLWIDPLDYQAELLAAARTLEHAALHTSIYNHQLCVLPPALHPLARKSISDWKNLYVEKCDACALKTECGGFFASAMLKRSRGIVALR